jgi:hypothetical protein
VSFEVCLDELSLTMGIPIIRLVESTTGRYGSTITGLVESKHGGNNRLGLPLQFHPVVDQAAHAPRALAQGLLHHGAENSR